MAGAAGILVVLVALRSGTERAAKPESVAVAEEKAAATNVPGKEARGIAKVISTPAEAQSVVPAEGQKNAAIDATAARVAQLQELAMAEDADSLNNILSDLDNQDPEIREAALQATIQFGSREAIPKLQELAARTEDRQIKRELEDAAEFLSLPSLTEVVEQNKAAAK